MERRGAHRRVISLARFQRWRRGSSGETGCGWSGQQLTVDLFLTGWQQGASGPGPSDEQLVTRSGARHVEQAAFPQDVAIVLRLVFQFRVTAMGSGTVSLFTPTTARRANSRPFAECIVPTRTPGLSSPRSVLASSLRGASKMPTRHPSARHERPDGQLPRPRVRASVVEFDAHDAEGVTRRWR